MVTDPDHKPERVYAACVKCGHPKHKHSGGYPNTCPIIATWTEPLPQAPAAEIGGEPSPPSWSEFAYATPAETIRKRETAPEFPGFIIGWYQRLDGARGYVMQHDPHRHVHVNPLGAVIARSPTDPAIAALREALETIQQCVEDEGYKVTAGQSRCKHIDALNEIHEITSAAFAQLNPGDHNDR